MGRNWFGTCCGSRKRDVDDVDAVENLGERSHIVRVGPLVHGEVGGLVRLGVELGGGAHDCAHVVAFREGLWDQVLEGAGGAVVDGDGLGRQDFS